MDKLAKWLLRTGMSQQDAAHKLGISAGYLSLLLANKRQPTARMALRIADATEGEVPVEAWR